MENGGSWVCHIQDALITDISPWAIFPDLCPVYVGLYIALPTHLTQCLPSLFYWNILAGGNSWFFQWNMQIKCTTPKGHSQEQGWCHEGSPILGSCKAVRVRCMWVSERDRRQLVYIPISRIQHFMVKWLKVMGEVGHPVFPEKDVPQFLPL